MRTAQSTTKERPLIMSGESVRAILEGRKTQTRRVVSSKTLRVSARHRITADWAGLLDPRGDLVCEAGEKYPGHIAHAGAVSAVMPSGKRLGLKPGEFDFVCPYADGPTRLSIEGDRGDRQVWRVRPASGRLWVRETLDAREPIARYAADHTPLSGGHSKLSPRIHPSIHMPRWASRLLLEVTEVRVERLQEITVGGIRKEGVDCPVHDFPSGFCASECGHLRQAFREGWDALNAERGHGWETNPWVWVISFRRLDP